MESDQMGYMIGQLLGLTAVFVTLWVICRGVRSAFHRIISGRANLTPLSTDEILQ